MAYSPTKNDGKRHKIYFFHNRLIVFAGKDTKKNRKNVMNIEIFLKEFRTFVPLI